MGLFIPRDAGTAKAPTTMRTTGYLFFRKGRGQVSLANPASGFRLRALIWSAIIMDAARFVPPAE